MALAPHRAWQFGDSPSILVVGAATGGNVAAFARICTCLIAAKDSVLIASSIGPRPRRTVGAGRASTRITPIGSDGRPVAVGPKGARQTCRRAPIDSPDTSHASRIGPPSRTGPHGTKQPDQRMDDSPETLFTLLFERRRPALLSASGPPPIPSTKHDDVGVARP